MIGDLAALRPEYGVEDRQDFGPKRPEMGQDHPDILPTAAQDSMERVTKRAFQGAAGEAAIRFHMADHRLDGTSTPQVAPERWGGGGITHRGYPASSACRQQTLPCGSSSPTLWSRRTTTLTQGDMPPTLGHHQLSGLTRKNAGITDHFKLM